MNEFKILNGYEVKDEEARKSLQYSSEETLTGEKWIDGKPIYRKVIQFGPAFDTDTDTSKTVAHGIELYDVITRFDCFYKPAANVRNVNKLPFIPLSTTLEDETNKINRISCYIDPIYIVTNRAVPAALQSRTDVYFIVEYTKQDLNTEE